MSDQWKPATKMHRHKRKLLIMEKDNDVLPNGKWSLVATNKSKTFKKKVETQPRNVENNQKLSRAREGMAEEDKSRNEIEITTKYTCTIAYAILDYHGRSHFALIAQPFRTGLHLPACWRSKIFDVPTP